MFLEISPNSQENICARDSFLIKLQTSGRLLLQQEWKCAIFKQENIFLPLAINWQFLYFLNKTKLSNIFVFQKLSTGCWTKSNFCLNFRFFKDIYAFSFNLFPFPSTYFSWLTLSICLFWKYHRNSSKLFFFGLCKYVIMVLSIGPTATNLKFRIPKYHIQR